MLKMCGFKKKKKKRRLFPHLEVMDNTSGAWGFFKLRALKGANTRISVLVFTSERFLPLSAALVIHSCHLYGGLDSIS